MKKLIAFLIAVIVISFLNVAFCQHDFNPLIAEKKSTIKNESKSFEDDFESYLVGGQIACQNSLDWTTWSNEPCGAEDAYIADEFAYSGNNSMIIESGNDVVKVWDNFTSGSYLISFLMYIPEGNNGYFNTLQDFSGSSSQWGMQVYFDEDGEGSVDAGGAGSGTFSYSYDTWILNEVFVDLDSDWAEYKVNGYSVVEWTWSSGSFGTGTLNQLGGSDFYAWEENGPSKYYVDDISLWSGGILPSPSNLIGLVNNCDVLLTWEFPDGGSQYNFEHYNLYRNGEIIDNIIDTFYYDMGLATGGYEYKVTAVYSIGESPFSDPELLQVDCFNSLSPPENLYLNSFENCVYELCWDSPSLVAEWIRWDAGVNNGNGIGIAEPGSFSTASRWATPDLEPFIGQYLTKVAFWNNDDPEATFVVKVWIGEGAATLIIEQAVPVAIPNEWTEVTLDIPVFINGTQELWFGYQVTPGTGGMPAGCDDGPAVQYRGDMFSIDEITWTSMSAEYGLDYNWNLAGFISSIPGEDGSEMIPKQISDNKNDVEDNPKSLLGFNIYKDGAFLEFTTSNCFTGSLQFEEIAEFCVSAVYDEGESNCSNEITIECLGCVLNPPQNLELQYPGSGFDVPLIWEAPEESTDALNDLISYNIYRDGEVVGNTTETEYVDEIPFLDIYDYCVTAIYDEGESECSNEVQLYFEGVNEGVHKYISLYPNPANDIVFIESIYNIERIKVFNYNGQLVDNETVNNTIYKVNTSNFVSGIYFFRIETSEGIISKRVIIQ
jgi:hypothetical protein